MTAEKDELAERARQLYHERACPGCRRALSLWEILSMAFGSAIDYSVKVLMPDGTERIVPAKSVNPQIMTIADEGK